MNTLAKIFFRGLAVILPVVGATVFIVWLGSGAEHLVGSVIRGWFGEQYYYPGIGTAVAIASIFLLGLLMYSWLMRKLVSLIDRALRHIPIFSSIYGTLRDALQLMSSDDGSKLGKPVLINIPNTDMKTLGFITRSDVDDLPAPLNKAGYVVVYVQWSSQIGGYCFLVPEDAIEPVEDMNIEQAMRWSLTAGLSIERKNGK